LPLFVVLEHLIPREMNFSKRNKQRKKGKMRKRKGNRSQKGKEKTRGKKKGKEKNMRKFRLSIAANNLKIP